MAQCGQETEVFSRCCGYFRPVKNWNKGKREEFKDRKMFDTELAKTGEAKKVTAAPAH